MADEKQSPYVCHIFVCTHDRQGKRKSCADGASPRVRAALKHEIKERGWRGQVRVSKSGCMGLCPHGPNVVIYPQKIWFSAVTPADISQITARVKEILDSYGRPGL